MLMALEAMVFSQDPLLGYFSKDLFSFGSLGFDFGGGFESIHGASAAASTVTPCAAGDMDGSCYAGEVQAEAAASGRRKRRRRNVKNREEVENQRMNHIAVERNRRKQMNEYLAVVRSIMPPSYVQRASLPSIHEWLKAKEMGDQASTIGGAINYVKELEQLLQTLEAQKKSSHHHQNQLEDSPNQDLDDAVSNNKPPSSSSSPFSDFFSSPQYSGSQKKAAAAAEIEVNMADSHANVKIQSERRPKQLLKLVAGFQALRLSVLHVNVATVDRLVLYSFSLKVDEGCHLDTVDEIAAAANHMLVKIQEEATLI